MATDLEIQRALKASGFDPGPLDGVAGAKTRAAVKAFQRARGLTVDGVVGPRTSAVLLVPMEQAPSPPKASVPSVLSDQLLQPRASRPITEIVVHCTATPEGRDVSVETIRGWHKAQGWKDIGYHWVVLLDGTVKPGRPEAQVGAHVEGHNTVTLGVVYVGGVAADGKTAKDTRTPAQRDALLAHVKALIERYPTVKKVSGHNQYAAKACPSFDVRKDDLGRIF